jgi:transcriptional regulator with XRE-family HTH domain
VSSHQILRDARRAARLTQAQLADRVGMSQPAIAKLERPGSNPRVGTLDRVLRGTGHRLQLIAPAWSDTIDERMLRADLPTTPAERVLSAKRLFDSSRLFADAGRRHRGELA